MDDNEIIGLYFQRSEAAIAESSRKYSGYCGAIARNILHSAEDAEECVNDTWAKAWDSIPPSRPGRLSVFLGKITRGLAIDRYRRSGAQKRGSGEVALCLDELAECVSDCSSIAEDYILKDALERFLRGLKADSAELFILRYWYMQPIKDIARSHSMSEAALKMKLHRIRAALKEFLETEGIEI
ncbi:MAG: RNA polymerase sigma factor [Ruminococcaceae bacterium]|nr:RNA polymerase sigma factor [Oscillospiraceae bacterium]